MGRPGACGEQTREREAAPGVFVIVRDPGRRLRELLSGVHETRPSKQCIRLSFVHWTRWRSVCSGLSILVRHVRGD
jgi:hypothetical protein